MNLLELTSRNKPSFAENVTEPYSAMRGLIDGVDNKLSILIKDMLQYQNKRGLIPVHEFKRRYNEARIFNNNKYGEPHMSKDVSYINRDDYHNGYIEADNIKIRPPVKDEAKKIYAIG